MAAHCSGCVFTVCVFTAVCVHLGWDKCRAQIPNMGHHTWSYVTFTFAVLWCHTMIDLRSANNQHLVILGNLEILCWTSPQEVARLVTLCHIHYNPLTTEELRRPIKGVCPAVQLFPVFLHMSFRDTNVFGLVDNFTSVRPFPHAEEHTSQRKAKIPVNSRS